MDEPNFEASEWSGHPVASEVAERIRSVIGAAEAAAGAVRHEAEQQAASRRRAAEEEARHYVEDAKRDAAAMLQERIRRINELSDAIIERSEEILSRLERADEVRRELQSLVDELGHTAARLAREVGEEAPSEPAAAAQPEPEVAEPEPEPQTPAMPEPAAVGEDTPSLRVAEPAEQPEPPAEEEEPAASITDLLTRPAEPPTGGEDDQLLGARLVALQMAVAGGNRGEVEAHLRRAFDLLNPQSILDDVFGRGTDASKRVVWPSAADGS